MTKMFTLFMNPDKNRRQVDLGTHSETNKGEIFYLLIFFIKIGTISTGERVFPLKLGFDLLESM
jgi:hypothetical protein